MTRVQGRRDFVRTVSKNRPLTGFLEDLYAELGARVRGAGKSTNRPQKPYVFLTLFF